MSGSSQVSTTFFSFGERLGMFFTILGGCFSAASVSPILLLAMYKWLRRTAKAWGRSEGSPNPIDNIIFLNLMIANLIRAVGNMLMVKWMLNAVITEGHICTFQAVVKQAGSTSMALLTLAIAVHTFCVLILRWRATKFISKLVVFIIWGFTALVIGTAYSFHRKEQYYGEAGYWCFVREGFKTDKIMTEYLWVWMTAPLMTILYFIMFVVMRGWFIVDNGVWHWHKNYRLRFGTVRPELEETRRQKYSKANANLMLYYPAVYIICIVPTSISRWQYFTGSKVTAQFTLFASTLFSFCGMFDAILFFFTRPDLVMGTDSPPLALARTRATETSDERSDGDLKWIPFPTGVEEGFELLSGY